MAYVLYGRKVFKAEVDGKDYTFTCYSQGTNYGFRHICCEGFSDTKECKYVKGDIVGKATYYNRSYESFKYETVLRKGIENVAPNKEVKEKLLKVLVEDRIKREHEECEREVKAFESLWNGLSEDNKQHIRNGLGDNLIQSEEQAKTVMGVMQLMTLLQ